MSNTYKVALIGCGHRGKEHARGMKAESRCNVVALVDLLVPAAEAINNEFGFGAAIYTDYKEMLAKEKPDLVIIALWTHLHLPVFKDCAMAGVKTILSEKPMSATWGGCLDMAHIAEETGCQLSFCHQRRFAKGNRLVRQMINEGRFGKLCRMDLYSPPHLLDCGTHTFDQAISYNNEVPVKWVLGAVDCNNPVSFFDVKAESMAVGTLVFRNGVRANIQVGGPDQDMWGGVRVIGTDGFIEAYWDGNFGKGAIYSDPTWQPPEMSSEIDYEMEDVMHNVVDCMESGEETEISYKKALRAAEIIYAFYESVRQNKRMELPLSGINDNPFITMLENREFGCQD